MGNKSNIRYAILLSFLAVFPLSAQTINPENSLIISGQFRQSSDDTAAISSLINASKKKQNDNVDSAIILAEKAFLLSKRIGYIDGCAWSLLALGTGYYNSGNVEKGRAIFQQAYPYCQYAVFAKRVLLLNWYNNMGSTYGAQGNYDTAASFYYKALDYITMKNKVDSNFTSMILQNLSSILLETKQYRKSLFYSRKGLGIAIAQHDSDRIASNNQNIGIALTKTGDIANSRRALQIAYSIHLKRNDLLDQQMDCYAIAQNATQLDTAIYYYNTALAIDQDKIKRSDAIYWGLGNVYFKIKKYDSASIYLNKALNLATKLNLKGDLIPIYLSLAKLYTAKNDFKLANKYQKAYSDMEDSLVNNKNLLSIDALEIKYRTAEKDKEIAEKQLLLTKTQNQIQKRNVWIIAISSTALALIVLLASLYRANEHKRKLQSQKLQTIQREQEIRDLKSVINGEEKERSRLARELHDGIMVLFSAAKMNLTMLPEHYAILSGEPDYEQIIQQLDHAMRELRQTAHNLMPDMLLEGGLAEAVFYFCKTLQQNTGLNIIFQQQGDPIPRFNQEFEISLYRLMQELVQNVIKHAHASKAIVQLVYREKVLYLNVTDNGVGFNAEDIKENLGMGLKSIFTRVRALNGLIEISSNEKTGTAIYLEFDIHKLAEEKIV